jgi:Zinc carboxypeptidase
VKRFLPGLRAAAALTALGLLLLLPGPPARAASTPQPPKAPQTPQSTEGYHRFAEVERQLQTWSKEHPELNVLTIGKSQGGRALYVARIASADATPPDERPAVFVGANVAGWHNAGTEAALDLIQRLLAGGDDVKSLLREHTFYVAPALNPDAHDAFFAIPRERRSGNAFALDHDRDGLTAEDPADDLNGDGVITALRIPDPAGGWLPDPQDPRVMVKADGPKQRAGAFKLETEGKDDDGDGDYNEDGADGVVPDRDFPHAFPYPDPDAGPWPGFAPETRAVMDFVLAHHNIAAAVVYGPANNLLAAPQSLGGGNADLGTQKFKVPPQAAKYLGFDPEKEYTLDEVWEAAKDLPFVKQNGVTKEQLGQYLGAGGATKVDPGDQGYLDKLAESYKERLKKAGLSADRPGAQYGKGGLTPWLYYQAGAMALELDVWGIPKAEKKAATGVDEALTLDKVAAMSSDEFVALGEEKIGAFLKDNKVPPQFSAQVVIGAMKGGQLDPKKMVDRMRSMGAGGGGGAGGGEKGDTGGERDREVLDWVDAHAPGAFHPWEPVTLPDGTKAEVGGLDPFITADPPAGILKPALAAHTDTVLDLAGKLARTEILSLDAKDLGGGVYRVRAVAGNRGWLPTHTKMAERGRFHLPVRLEIETGAGVELVTGHPAVTSERLEGTSGTLEGEWLVRAAPGASIAVRVTTDNAGRDRKTAILRQAAGKTAGKGA